MDTNTIIPNLPEAKLQAITESRKAFRAALKAAIEVINYQYEIEDGLCGPCVIQDPMASRLMAGKAFERALYVHVPVNIQGVISDLALQPGQTYTVGNKGARRVVVPNYQDFIRPVIAAA